MCLCLTKWLGCIVLPRRYTISKKNLKDLFVHLTNYSINKGSADFQANAGDGDEASGHKWSFAALRRHWTEQGVDVGRVMAAVRHLVAKTFVAVEAEVWGRCYEMMGSRASAFELFGFDLMFEEDLTPRLVEVIVCCNGALQWCAFSVHSLCFWRVFAGAGQCEPVSCLRLAARLPHQINALRGHVALGWSATACNKQNSGKGASTTT